jgi:hypothetical protein
MKKLIGCVCAIAVTGLFIGCVPIIYTKSVATHMDATGRVTETVITESVSERHSEPTRIESTPSGMKLKHIQE